MGAGGHLGHCVFRDLGAVPWDPESAEGSPASGKGEEALPFLLIPKLWNPSRSIIARAKLRYDDSFKRTSWAAGGGRQEEGEH